MLAKLEERGVVSGVVTQNVDSLHREKLDISMHMRARVMSDLVSWNLPVVLLA